MSLKQKIEVEIKSGMINKDNVRRDVMRFLKSEISRFEGGKIVYDDKDIITLVKKNIENLKITNSETSQKEIEILSELLPKQLTELEVNDIITNIIGNGSYSTIKDMGKIIKDFNVDNSGKADNGLVSKIIKEKLGL